MRVNKLKTAPPHPIQTGGKYVLSSTTRGIVPLSPGSSLIECAPVGETALLDCAIGVRLPSVAILFALSSTNRLIGDDLHVGWELTNILGQIEPPPTVGA
jgi:hypothetical protein